MMMTFETFKILARSHRTIPVYERILADLLTPISAFMRISQGAQHAFLFESVEKGSRYARYSFLGRNPRKIISSIQGSTFVSDKDKRVSIDQPFLELLRSIRSEYAVPPLSDIPGFTGGLVGYLGYETIGWMEKVPLHPPDDLNLPDAVFMLFENIIAFDHLKHEALVISNVNVNSDTDLKQAYEQARVEIDTLGEDLHTDIDYQTPPEIERSAVHSELQEKDFKSAVNKAKDYIRAGDVFQVVLSQRFSRKTPVEPITLYRALRTINPSPYMFYLKLSDLDIIGASPEMLVKVEGDEMEIRPIAGTRSRGRSAEEDQALGEELKADEKERAEHLMLVDLGRNDVGRVCRTGTVRVEEFMAVEQYSHVMHLVSSVKGWLRPELDSLDALMAGFPAGTLSGAPKIRAMEIIYELEPVRRGVYSGAIGYLDFSGNLNTCIAIRTMVMKGHTVYFQSGAGIVHDSGPGREFTETLHKAQALVQAIDFAENGLVREKLASLGA